MILEFIRDMMQARFWGTLTLKFQDGKPVQILKEESIKPEHLSENRKATTNTGSSGANSQA